MTRSATKSMPSKLPQPKESAVLRLILDYLSAHKIFHWRANSGALKVNDRFVRFGGMVGMADIVGILGTSTSPLGRMFCIEVKRDTKSKVSEAQQAFLSEINNRGGLAFIATNIQDVINNGL